MQSCQKNWEPDPHPAKSICDILSNLVLFVQFKKREKHPWKSITFSQPATWVFFTFFKLYKWYEIAQRITFMWFWCQIEEYVTNNQNGTENGWQKQLFRGILQSMWYENFGKLPGKYPRWSSLIVKLHATRKNELKRACFLGNVLDFFRTPLDGCF